MAYPLHKAAAVFAEVGAFMSKQQITPKAIQLHDRLASLGDGVSMNSGSLTKRDFHKIDCAQANAYQIGKLSDGKCTDNSIVGPRVRVFDIRNQQWSRLYEIIQPVFAATVSSRPGHPWHEHLRQVLEELRNCNRVSMANVERLAHMIETAFHMGCAERLGE